MSKVSDLIEALCKEAMEAHEIVEKTMNEMKDISPKQARTIVSSLVHNWCEKNDEDEIMFMIDCIRAARFYEKEVKDE